MQTNYVYFLTEPEGENFRSGIQTGMTPAEMLALGVFGGKYMTDCAKEFPKAWFVQARLCHERHDPELNFFEINASQPYPYWREKGWIYHEDPRGWFQWYCRYYMAVAARTTRGKFGDGRRCSGTSPRFGKTAAKAISIVVASQRQALLHWAYDSRKL